MIRGLYTAAAGLETGLRLQEVVAENLANSATTGYKGERGAAREFAGVLARRVGNVPVPVPLTMETILGRVGTGSFVETRRIDLESGTPRATGRPLDVMILGEGLFAVRAPDGVRYTRDGHFLRNAQDRLITADGSLVLGRDGEPLTLNTDDIRIDRFGQIFRRVPVTLVTPEGLTRVEVREEAAGAFQVVTARAESLVRAGHTRFTLVPNANAQVTDLGGASVMLQGTLEESNVQVAAVATQLMSLSRTYQASQHVFTTINETLRATVSEIGRVGNG